MTTYRDAALQRVADHMHNATRHEARSAAHRRMADSHRIEAYREVVLHGLCPTGEPSMSCCGVPADCLAL